VRSTARSPAIVVRRIGSSAWRISTRIATRAPSPPISGSGSRKPNIARLGIVWTTLANHTMGGPSRGGARWRGPRGGGRREPRASCGEHADREPDGDRGGRGGADEHDVLQQQREKLR